MKNNLALLLEIIKQDYKRFMPTNRDMQERFNAELHYEEGRKYIKVITGGSVWGFIVNVDNDKKFRRGDILKAASWNAPARNQPRGNILDGDYSWVRWTGPAYL